MVKIYTVKSRPNFKIPWNKTGPVNMSGSGCVIEGNLVLTNAHVVSNQTFVQVRLFGHPELFEASVLAVSHDADLALLTVDKKNFFEKTTALRFGKLPEVRAEVTVYGFPQGGDTLSITQGVKSRIENQDYAHSKVILLAVQLDAAVNPGNSGGPVMIGNRIVGVVMQSLYRAENIGYMVPTPVINHFLKDREDGHVDGFPDPGVIWQTTRNEGFKKKLGLEEMVET